jgi:hypothetical protein
VGVLFNPDTLASEAAIREIHMAAAALSPRVSVVHARTVNEIDAAFAELARLRPDALLSINDPLFATRASQLGLLATRYALPAMLTQQEYAEAGGLMLRAQSGGHLSSDRHLHRTDSERSQAGGFAGRAIVKVRIRYQSAGGQGARAGHSCDFARASRCGNRVKSAIGTYRT